MIEFSALNARTKIVAETGNEYWTPDEGTHALVLRRKRENGTMGSRMVLTSWGREDLGIGSVVSLIGDQSGRRMGQYEVVGQVVSGRSEGDSATARPVRHFVVK